MIKGLESFKKWFKEYEDQYIIIGGTACDILMMDTGIYFRATKDIDLVLILETMTPEFGKTFWEYILEAGYEHFNKSSGKPQFYRFSKPKSAEFPAMIELFSRKADALDLPDKTILEPLHIGDEVSSLSAILLNDDYYNFLKKGKTIIDEVPILNTEYIIPFKMKAWLDLSEKKANGQKIDSKDINKHKNDIFRLTELIYPENRIRVTKSIYEDIQNFINKMDSEIIPLKQLGIVNQNKEEILEELKKIYYVTKS